jgi:hypothetical protein
LRSADHLGHQYTTFLAHWVENDYRLLRLPIGDAATNERKQAMTRNFKVLGLAVIAALALGAVAASVASAEGEEPISRPYWFKSDGFSTTTTTVTGVGGKGGHEFETETLNIVCTTATYKGTLVGETATTTNLVPTYGGCTAGGLSATVDVNGCSYTLHTDEQTGNVTSPIIIDWFNAYDTTTTIECPTTKIDGKEVTDEIKITVSMDGTLKCTIDIPSRTWEQGSSSRKRAGGS